MHLFCKPQPAGRKFPRATRETHPAEWQRFIEYAALDIVAMRAIDRAIPEWNGTPEETALWHLDQTINDRGMAIDLPLARAAVAAVDTAQHQLTHRTGQLTGGAINTTGQRDAMIAHVLEEYSITLPDLQASTLERRINDPDLPEGLRELLSVRLQASTTSTTKYRTLLNSVSSDGRLRGTKQFCGASRTGRWAGRLFQPDNMMRPTMDADIIDLGIEALKIGSADLIFADMMELTSNAIRGCIVAPKGKKLVVSDLSNIEGRVQAWLAGERWKLDAFRAFDAGAGPDLYKMAYAKSFGIKPDQVDKSQRQVGKVQELALGYEGGVGAFLTFATTYNIDLEAMGAQAFAQLPPDIRDESDEFYLWATKQGRPTFGLSRQAFVVCEGFKRSWRRAHARIAQFWKDLADAITFAICNNGEAITVGPLQIVRLGAWLRIILPSGRSLCYPSPAVDDAGTITYWGINQYTRKWSRIPSYGGKFFENVCQAVARDVMAANMAPIEAAGYEIVLTVHDEVICEAPDDARFNTVHLSALLAANPSWAPTMPLAAGGFEGYRYRKG